jgi:hypothetical protein
MRYARFTNPDLTQRFPISHVAGDDNIGFITHRLKLIPPIETPENTHHFPKERMRSYEFEKGQNTVSIGIPCDPRDFLR